MQLYNYVAGGSFPPFMPEGFNEGKFGNIDVVIFALNDTDTRYTHDFAMRLQTDINFRGLVYSFVPENSDYLKCADFFRVPVFPSYVVVSYRAFRELLCTNPKISPLNVDNKYFRNPDLYEKNQLMRTYRHSHMECMEELNYIIINGEILRKNSFKNIMDEVFQLMRRFCIEGITKTEGPLQYFGKISRSNLDVLKNSTKPYDYDTEITVLFTRPAWRHTEFERLLYEEFIKFGSITDDVMIRILYPSHISSEYAKHIEEYDIIKLPAAIFKHRRTGRLVVKVERDFFESIPNLNKRVAFIISDIHRAIAAGHTTLAKNLVKELQTYPKGKTVGVKETKTTAGKSVIQLEPEEVLEMKEKDMPDELKLHKKTELRELSIKLKEILESKLSLEEIRDFCFEIDIDYENIGGEAKSGKIREILIHLERRNKLEIMKLWLKNKRPDIWIKNSQRYDEIMKTPSIDGREADELPESSSKVNKEPKNSIINIEINNSNGVQIVHGSGNKQVQGSILPNNKGSKKPKTPSK